MHPHPPKNGLVALLPSTNGAIPYFLVLPGSDLSIADITEYTYVFNRAMHPHTSALTVKPRLLGVRCGGGREQVREEVDGLFV